MGNKRFRNERNRGAQSGRFRCASLGVHLQQQYVSAFAAATTITSCDISSEGLHASASNLTRHGKTLRDSSTQEARRVRGQRNTRDEFLERRREFQTVSAQEI